MTGSGCVEVVGCGGATRGGVCGLVGGVLPMSIARKVWIPSILSGGASWMPAMASVRQGHCVEDPVGGGDGGYWYFVVAKTEGVGGALAPWFCHDDADASVVLSRVGEVPSLGCMVPPCFASMWFHVHLVLLSQVVPLVLR